MEKTKVEDEATSKQKKKKKADKMKDLMVLTKGELDLIRDKIQEATIESWNIVEDHYGALLASVAEQIVELNILAQMVRQSLQIEERDGE